MAKARPRPARMASRGKTARPTPKGARARAASPRAPVGDAEQVAVSVAPSVAASALSTEAPAAVTPFLGTDGAGEDIVTSLMGQAAEAIAASVAEEAPLDNDGPLRQLRDALLAESADVNEAAASRCRRLRSTLAVAVLAALAKRPRAAPLVTHSRSGGAQSESSSAKVRVEVRQTAGRKLGLEAFTVGRAHECDVQTFGDHTVSRLQFLVIVLPGALVVLDAWSSGGTRTVRRQDPSLSLPTSVPRARAAFVLPHGERVILLIGAKTTVSLGPSARDAGKLALPPKATPSTPAAGAALAKAKAKAKVAAAVFPAAVSEAATACSAADRAAGPPKEARVAATTPPKAPKAAPLDTPSPLAPPAPPAQSAGAAAAPAALLATLTSDLVHAQVKVADPAEPVAAASTPVAALRRCFNAVRAVVRLQSAVRDRQRLRWRCRAALRLGAIAAGEQGEALERRFAAAAGADGLEALGDFLDGLGVPPALDEALPASAASKSWTCDVCREPQRCRGWHCPLGHRCCRACALRRLRGDGSATSPPGPPSCPCDGCGYLLGELDLEDLRVDATLLDAFRVANAAENRTMEATKRESEHSAEIFRCQGAGCGAALRRGAGESRRKWECPCGASPTCIGCGTHPYHYHARCRDVQALRARWFAWQRSGGREAYRGLQRRAAKDATVQQRLLKAAAERQAKLERDEQWKVDHCRHCPKCQQVVQKIDGCGTMVCGKNASGVDGQAGCGHRFTWQSGKAYKPKVKAQKVQAPALARVTAVSGRGVRHVFTQCSLCGSGGKCIVGPRFRCIHCPDFNCCLKCEERLASEHQAGHVFEIMFEDEVDWSSVGVTLPKGTRARIRSSSCGPAVVTEQAPAAIAAGDADVDDANAPEHEDDGGGRKRQRADDYGLEGVVRGQKRSKYILEVAGEDGVSHLVPACRLQPLLTGQQAERVLAAIPPPAPPA